MLDINKKLKEVKENSLFLKNINVLRISMLNKVIYYYSIAIILFFTKNENNNNTIIEVSKEKKNNAKTIINFITNFANKNTIGISVQKRNHKPLY
jgi:hypothetical protein